MRVIKLDIANTDIPVYTVVVNSRSGESTWVFYQRSSFLTVARSDAKFAVASLWYIHFTNLLKNVKPGSENYNRLTEVLACAMLACHHGTD